ncbi:MAG: nucleoside monophosphate kinase [Holosporales bacterium]|nr:nucleoside monophosphate kinase [Holosporales bacterium]
MSRLWTVFLGVPGCGKGTQAGFLVQNYGFSVVAVGDILRKNRDKVIASDGGTIGALMEGGNLLPDDIVVGCVRDELNGAHSGEYTRSIIFDGFPRTLGQAKALAGLLAELGLKDGYVLNFVVDDEVITKRILGRYSCGKCGRIYNDFFLRPRVEGVCDVCGHGEFDRRCDDNDVSLKKRLAEYREKTEVLVGYYQDLGILSNIDAAASFDNVSAEVMNVLGLSKKER